MVKPDKCEFTDCQRLPALYQILPPNRKVWYCVEHYDRMVDFYKGGVDFEDQWSMDLVDRNGW